MIICLNCMEEVGDSQEICPFCQSNLNESLLQRYNEIKPGEILKNRYIIGRVLNREKSQIRYIGKDILLKRIVQIVEFFPEEYLDRPGSFEIILKNGANSKEYTIVEKKFSDYYRDIMLLYKEREVLDVYSCFMYNNTCYAIEQYLKSKTYDVHLCQNNKINAVASLDLFGKAMRSVSKLHNIGLYHGNIKTSSFIFGATAEDVIVKDFYPRMNLKIDEAQTEDRRALATLFACLTLGSISVMDVDIRQLLTSDKTGLSSKIKNEILLLLDEDSSVKSLDKIFKDIFDDSRTINQKNDSKTITRKSSRKFNNKSDNKLKNKVNRRILFALLAVVIIAITSIIGFFIGKRFIVDNKKNKSIIQEPVIDFESKDFTENSISEDNEATHETEISKESLNEESKKETLIEGSKKETLIEGSKKETLTEDSKKETLTKDSKNTNINNKKSTDSNANIQ